MVKQRYQIKQRDTFKGLLKNIKNYKNRTSAGCIEPGG
jgi:hypothetical protein